MFFVGVLLIVQTSWSCVCNAEIKKRVWVGCSRDYTNELQPQYEKLRHKVYFPFTTNFHYIQMQLFRILFLEVFDLPPDFSYPHCESFLAVNLSFFLFFVRVDAFSNFPFNFFVRSRLQQIAGRAHRGTRGCSIQQLRVGSLLRGPLGVSYSILRSVGICAGARTRASRGEATGHLALTSRVRGDL